MPVKRPRARIQTPRPDAPLAAWADLFALGADYFGNLDPYDIDPRDEAAVRDAWLHYGGAYLDVWHALRETYFPNDPSAKPWALTKFGDPR